MNSEQSLDLPDICKNCLRWNLLDLLSWNLLDLLVSARGRERGLMCTVMSASRKARIKGLLLRHSIRLGLTLSCQISLTSIQKWSEVESLVKLRVQTELEL